MFEPYIGDWQLDLTGETIDGVPAQSHGSMHMDRVLDGRAVQDVWFMPAEDPSSPPLFHGTTVRFFDARIDGWRSTWIEPVHGRVITFIGHGQGADINLVSTNTDTRFTWQFRNMRGDSFTWFGSRSHDEGRSWHQYVRMDARRMRAEV